MSNVISANDGSFEAEVLKSDKTVLVDFWAEWCGPCKQVLPVLDELSEEMDSVKIVKINIEESPETPSKYGVRSIPTLMLFKGGEMTEVKVGAMTKSQMQEWLSANQ